MTWQQSIVTATPDLTSCLIADDITQFGIPVPKRVSQDPVSSSRGDLPHSLVHLLTHSINIYGAYDVPHARFFAIIERRRGT